MTTEIIPDGIEPIVGYRSWGFDGEGHLVSNQTGLRWPHGKACEAVCPVVREEWFAVEGGSSLEELYESFQASTQDLRGRVPIQGPGYAYQVVHAAIASSASSTAHGLYGALALPNVRLPEGWGYEKRMITHEPPEESCSCGLYAASAESGVPNNVIWGEVYLWGKVIPGDWAHRAQYAYPKSLKTYASGPEGKAKLLELLEPYGVPVEVLENKGALAPPSPYFIPYPSQANSGVNPYLGGFTSTSSGTVTLNSGQSITVSPGDTVQFSAQKPLDVSFFAKWWDSVKKR